MSRRVRRGFGRYLARKMVDAGYDTDVALGLALDINSSVIGRWRSEATRPDVDNLRALAPVLGVNPLELLVEAGYFPRHEIEAAARDYAERSARPTA